MDATTTAADLGWGAFSDAPPWVLDRQGISWLAGAADLRRAAAASVPGLIAARRTPPGKRVGTVTWHLGRALGGWYAGKKRGAYREPGASTAELSRRLRLAAVELGSTYIKLGQIISAGEGVFPAELVAEFKLCRDRVPAEPWDEVRAVIEGELGGPLAEHFAWIDRVPVAAASIAQVHAARLATGEEVVVKVQRPRVASLVRQDLKVMGWLAPPLVGRIPVASLANPPALVELFAETIVEELDFRLEASNMLDVATMLRDAGQDRFVVPRPHPVLVTPRVLVMERLNGFAFDDVEGMHAAGIDTEAVIRTGMVAFVEGALIHGIFHGDLHGGNLLVLPDGRSGLLDFGIVGRLSDQRRQAFLRLMLCSMTNDVRGQVAALRDLGALPGDVDIDAVIHDLRLDRPPVDPTTLSGEELVHEVQRVVKALLGYGARLPKELMLYVKNLIFLDGAIARLAPNLDLLAEIASISMYFTRTHGERIGRELGFDVGSLEVDLDSVKAGLGLDADLDRLTYRDLRKRRELINKRMRDHRRGPR